MYSCEILGFNCVLLLLLLLLLISLSPVETTYFSELHSCIILHINQFGRLN
jgi:hypothetical protein